MCVYVSPNVKLHAIVRFYFFLFYYILINFLSFSFFARQISFPFAKSLFLIDLKQNPLYRSTDLLKIAMLFLLIFFPFFTVFLDVKKKWNISDFIHHFIQIFFHLRRLNFIWRRQIWHEDTFIEPPKRVEPFNNWGNTLELTFKLILM